MRERMRRTGSTMEEVGAVVGVLGGGRCAGGGGWAGGVGMGVGVLVLVLGLVRVGDRGGRPGMAAIMLGVRGVGGGESRWEGER